MNDKISTQQLESLMTHQSHPSLSIFMPAHRIGADAVQDVIRLKNLLQEAENRLSDLGIRTPEIRALLRPANDLLSSSDFWQNQSDGLAVFMAKDDFRFFRVPLALEELLIVSDRYHVKPLLPYFSHDGRFFVLALSQNEIRLLQGAKHTVEEMSLEDVPQSLVEALRFDDPESQLQHHSSSAGAGGRPAAVFHGHAVGHDDEKDDILRYFHQVDRGLKSILGDEQSPLILAGVDYLLPIYRQANTYPHLLDVGIEGNPEQFDAKTLHAKAWELVEPYFASEQAAALDRYHTLAGTGKTMAQIEKIVEAAFQGRIDTLFLPADTQVWGTFDPGRSEVTIESEQAATNEDLLDLAAVHTLLQGGRVFMVSPDEIPNQQTAVSILRF